METIKSNKLVPGVTFSGPITINGPMFDIHDNHHVTIVSNTKEGKSDATASEELSPNTVSDDTSTHLPFCLDKMIAE